MRVKDRPFGTRILVTIFTASTLWHTVFILLSYPCYSSSRQAYINTNILSQSRFPAVNKHITIQGHQQNAAEPIWKLTNVNKPKVRRTGRLNTTAMAATNDTRLACSLNHYSRQRHTVYTRPRSPCPMCTFSGVYDRCYSHDSVLGQWFPKCAPRIPRDTRPFPRVPVDTFL